VNPGDVRLAWSTYGAQAPRIATSTARRRPERGTLVQAEGLSRDARIVIVGAGAAGICAAWYLKQAGFHRVKVLEQSPRLGGKCRSLTVDGQSFDLGANYVTSSYRRVRELASHVGASMYTERKGHAIDAQGKVGSLLGAVLRGQSFLAVASQSLRFLWKRWRLRKLLTPYRPGFGHVTDHPELRGSFADWLDRNGLPALKEMFEIPLTLMGYGRLEGIAAVYALTYMNPLTFKDLGLFAVDPPLRRWPKRFSQGYGRMFERLAAEVNVLTGVTNLKIDRSGPVQVEYDLIVQQLEGQTTVRERDTFDCLVIACPQRLEVLEPMVELTPEERRLFGQVIYNPFYVTTYDAPGTEAIAAVTFALPLPETGQPFVVTRQFPHNDFVSVYTRGDRGNTIGRHEVWAANESFLARIMDRAPTRQSRTCDEWAYFPHVPVDALDAGFYRDLEALQGANRTYYCGGLLAFELVETIAEYSHHLVQTHFVGRGNA
jgi:predicted NAD/FAD-binding protein